MECTFCTVMAICSGKTISITADTYYTRLCYEYLLQSTLSLYTMHTSQSCITIFLHMEWAIIHCNAFPGAYWSFPFCLCSKHVRKWRSQKSYQRCYQHVSATRELPSTGNGTEVACLCLCQLATLLPYCSSTGNGTEVACLCLCQLATLLPYCSSRKRG